MSFGFMKKSIFVLLCIIVFTIAVAAMPPHPKLVDEMMKKGMYEQLQNRLNSMKARNMDSAERTAPSTGNANFLVICIQYSDVHFRTAQSTPFFPLFPDKNKFNFIFLMIMFLGLLIIFLILKKQRIKTAYAFLSFVLLITFSSCAPVDTPLTGTDPTQFYSDLFNTTGTNSFKQYYLDMSNNALNLTFDVVGTYTAMFDLSFYGANDPSGNDYFPGRLVGEAIDAAEASGVDFAKYDNDGNGEVDGILIIHTGPGEEIGGGVYGDNAIWSHRWDLDSAQTYGDGTGHRTYDGKIINDYAIQPEYNSVPGDSTIGVFTHEFGHVLGLPDLYDTQGQGTDGVGDWSLMASGSYGGPSWDGSYPSSLLAWEKEKLGWITVTEVLSGTNQPQTLSDIESSPVALKVAIGGGQYLYFENKVIIAGTWTAYIPGSGLLITRIHPTYITGSYLDYNIVNSSVDTSGNTVTGRPHGVEIEEADGNNALWVTGDNNWGEVTDLFYSPYKTSAGVPFTNYYSASNEAPNPSLTSGVSITSISVSGATMTFQITKP